MIRVLNWIVDFVSWIYTIPRRYDQERRQSIQYKARKQILKKVWIVASIIMLGMMIVFPGMVGVVFSVVLGLFTVFMSLQFLDETKYK